MHMVACYTGLPRLLPTEVYGCIGPCLQLTIAHRECVWLSVTMFPIYYYPQRRCMAESDPVLHTRFPTEEVYDYLWPSSFLEVGS